MEKNDWPCKHCHRPLSEHSDPSVYIQRWCVAGDKSDFGIYEPMSNLEWLESKVSESNLAL